MYKVVRWKNYFLCFFLSLSAILFTTHAHPLKKFESLGIQTLKGHPPTDFSLKNLSGKEQSLSHYKGRWIWLVFWATWCSICKKNMPTLESLHQEFKDKNFTVVGVSLDQNQGHLQNYVKKSALSFPLLHDPNNQVASRYQVHGVPSTYLISPDWKLVGLARGAINWEKKETLNKVKELLKHKTIASPQNGQAPLSPPRLEMKIPSPLVAKKWLPLKIQVTWPGPSHEYLIKVPQIKIPKEVQLGTISSSSQTGQSGENNSTLIYHFPLLFKKAGSYQIGPVDLSYRSRTISDQGGQTTRKPSLTLNIKEAPLFSWKLISLISSTSLLIILTASFWLRKKATKKRGSLPSSPSSPLSQSELLDQWIYTFQKAKKYKIEGKQKEYCLNLFELCQQMINQHPYGKKKLPK